MNKMIVSVALALSVIATPLMAKTIQIGTEGAYAPWNFLDDDGKLAGFEIDLGHALCKEAKLECKFKVNEWDSMIPNLVAGNFDLIMAGMSVTEKRLKTISFSDEYYPVEKSQMAGESGKTLDFDNLKGLRIGVQGATVQAGWLEENLAKDNTIKSYEKPDQSVADLMAGNIDLILADGTFLGLAVKGSKGAIEIVGPGYAIGGAPGIGMRKTDSELMGKMNAAIAVLKKNGTLDKLIKQYFKVGPFYSTVAPSLESVMSHVNALEKRVKALESNK